MPNLNTQDLPQTVNWYSLPHDKKIAVLEVSQLKPRSKEKKFTFVLDLDNTLIYTVVETGSVLLRPGILEFLKHLKRLELFEVIIWSTGKKIHVDKCSQFLEPYIDQALAKGSWDPIKNVELLTDDGSRTLDEILIIDDTRKVFEANKEHAIPVHPFLPLSTDTVFLKLHRYCRRAFLEPFLALKFKERILFLTEKFKPTFPHEEYLPFFPTRKVETLPLSLLKSSYFQQSTIETRVTEVIDFTKEHCILPEIKLVSLTRK